MRPSSSEELSSSPPPPLHRRRPRKIPSQEYSDQESSSNSHHPSQSSYSQHQQQSNSDDDDITDDVNNYSSSSSSLLPSTYINVAPLPIFRGPPTDCPLAHLSRFRRVCRANNVSSLPSVLRIFPVTLDDQAALWYDLNVEPYPSMQWQDIKSAFLAAFLKPESIDKARSDLMALKQGDGESVSMFHLRMRWILMKWPDHGLPDSLLKGLFVDGLREDFQEWVVPQRPETLEEAVRLAANWEQVESLRTARRRRDQVVVVKCGFCDGDGHEERECEVRRRMRELWLKRKEEGGEVGVGEYLGEVIKKGEGAAAAAAMGRVVSLARRGQCQCGKHQCWKKIERSSSVVSEKNNAGSAADQYS